MIGCFLKKIAKKSEKIKYFALQKKKEVIFLKRVD
jgi:hypothetical protein